MNSLELRITDVPPSDFHVRYRAELHADGQLVTPHPKYDDGLAIHLVALTQAALSEGDFFILTCVCSDPGCAGIDRPVTAIQRGSKTVWHFNSLGDAPTFTFERARFVEGALSALRRLQLEIPSNVPRDKFPIGPTTFDSIYLDWCITNLAAGRILSDPYARFKR